jgi:hypothetical protein
MVMPAPSAMMVPLRLRRQALGRRDLIRTWKRRGYADAAKRETRCKQGTGYEVTHCCFSFFRTIPVRQYDAVKFAIKVAWIDPWRNLFSMHTTSIQHPFRSCAQRC